MGLVQVLIGVPFLAHYPTEYLSRAFELSRQFFFKWTVNWRFVGEEIFLSKGFALTLLALHVLALGIFVTTRWIKPARKSLVQLISPVLLAGKPPLTGPEHRAAARDVTPRYIMTTILSANAVGLLFARSLHYQFYTYVAWSTPFLLWRAGLHPVLVYLLWAVQEWAWNVFPSTPASSAVVVGVLGVTAAGVWFGAREEWELGMKSSSKKEAAMR